MVLLVVDTQNSIMTTELYNFENFKSNIKNLISLCRENKVEVIFVRHNDESDEDFKKGTNGFQIFNEFEPLESEKIFDKIHNSAFKETGLSEYLKSKKEDTVIIAGLQTDYCIDATIKSGFEIGYKMIAPENTNSTFDNDYLSKEKTYEYYNNFIWKDRYAECVTFEEAVKIIKE